MNSSTILWHLAWKDIRLLAPALMLTLAGSLAFYFPVLTYAKELAPVNVDTLLAIQTIFAPLLALAAGAFLVGAERENRSMDWLSSLPVSWKGVAISKSLVAVCSLLLTIAVQLLLLQFVDPNTWNGFSATGPSPILAGALFAIFVINTLLFSGLLCLLTRNTLAAAALVLPAVAIYYLAVVTALDLVWRQAWWQPIYGIDPSSGLEMGWFYVISLLLCSLVFAVGLVFGLRRLIAQGGELSLFPTGSRKSTSTRWVPLVSPSVPESVPSGPFESLMWQQWRAMKWFWGAVLLVSIAVPLLLTLNPSPLLQIFILLLFALPAAIGVSVFSPDWARNGYQQLAFAGVSPMRFWSQRQIVPIVLLVGLGCVSYLFVVMAPREYRLSQRAIVVPSYIMWGWLSYWTSVCLTVLDRRQLLAGLSAFVSSLGVAVVGMGVTWYVGPGQMFGLGCLISIPLVLASYAMISDKFERGELFRIRRLIRWLGGGSILCILLLIPMRIWEVPYVQSSTIWLNQPTFPQVVGSQGERVTVQTMGQMTGQVIASVDFASADRFRGQSWLKYWLAKSPWERARAERLAAWINANYLTQERLFEYYTTRTLLTIKLPQNRMVIPYTPPTVVPEDDVPLYGGEEVGMSGLDEAAMLYSAEEFLGDAPSDSEMYGYEASAADSNEDALPDLDEQVEAQFPLQEGPPSPEVPNP